MTFTFTLEAFDAWTKGRADGTITDSIDTIIDIVFDQDVVSYASEHGTYTFDYCDVVVGLGE